MIAVFLKAGSFFKFIEILLLSGVKFIFAPPLSFKLGFTYFQTILITTIGGILGVLFFFYLSEIILWLFRKAWPYIKAYFSGKAIHIPIPIVKNKKPAKNKKLFTRKNKLIVKTRRKYGLWGITALMPLLSIPLGSFLANKYYKDKKNILLKLTLSVVCWSLFMSSLYAIFKIKPF